MGVGHHTTDEVRVGLVEGGHQVIKLALEVGGDSLATLALLPVLVLGSLQGLEKERGFSIIISFFNQYPIAKGDMETVYSQVGLMGYYLARVILEALDGQSVAAILDQLNLG